VVSPPAARKSGATTPGRSVSHTAHLKGVPAARSGTPKEEAQALDSLIHHRLRLGIVSALAGAESMSFNDIKALLNITDGNLSVHARKLEDARYIECRKFFADRRPHTEYRLATAGRKALQRYLNHMEALIQVTRHTLER